MDGRGKRWPPEVRGGTRRCTPLVLCHAMLRDAVREQVRVTLRDVRPRVPLPPGAYFKTNGMWLRTVLMIDARRSDGINVTQAALPSIDSGGLPYLLHPSHLWCPLLRHSGGAAEHRRRGQPHAELRDGYADAAAATAHRAAARRRYSYEGPPAVGGATRGRPLTQRCRAAQARASCPLSTRLSRASAT